MLFEICFKVAKSFVYKSNPKITLRACFFWEGLKVPRLDGWFLLLQTLFSWHAGLIEKKPLRNKAHKKDEWSAQSGMSERWLVGSPFNGRLFLCFSHVLFLSKLSVWYWFPSQMRLSCLIPLTQSNMVPAMAKTSWIFKTSKIFNLWELTFTVFYRLSYAVIFFVFPFST